MPTTALLPLIVPLVLLQGPPTLSLRLADGEPMRAQVLALDGELATLRVLVIGGELTVKRKLADFEPQSAFRIEEAATRPESFDQHFALARKAAAMRLLGPAGAQARAAIDTLGDDPDAEQKRAALRSWAADALEQRTREAIDEADLATARHCLKLLTTRLPELRSEAQIDELSALVQRLYERLDAEKAAARQARLDERQRKEIARRLQPVAALIEQGDALQREAIRVSRHTVRSARLAERSIDAYRAAWQRTLELAERHPDAAELPREVEAIGRRLHDRAIRSALHAANVLTVQSDYRGALEWANRVLAFDPDHAEAKQMVRTIQVAAAAASSNWGWGWAMPVVGGEDPRQR